MGAYHFGNRCMTLRNFEAIVEVAGLRGKSILSAAELRHIRPLFPNVPELLLTKNFPQSLIHSPLQSRKVLIVHGVPKLSLGRPSPRESKSLSPGYSVAMIQHSFAYIYLSIEEILQTIRNVMHTISNARNSSPAHQAS